MSQIHCRLDLDLKQGWNLPATRASTRARTSSRTSTRTSTSSRTSTRTSTSGLSGAAGAGCGQEPHSRGGLGEGGDALLPQVLQLQLILVGNLLLDVDDLDKNTHTDTHTQTEVKMRMLLHV